MGERIRLRDGRWLGYAEYGDRAGKPLLLFHGLPGSRLFRPPDDSIAATLGVRLITVDRPGFGLSSYQAGRALLDWPRDVEALADALALDSFAAAGMSAGGAYAMACAHALPDRVTSVGLISSAAPYHARDATQGMALGTRISYAWAGCRWLPEWALYPSVGMVAALACGDPETFWFAIRQVSTPRDRAVLALPGVKSVFLESLPEAYRSGPGGHVHDARLVALDWGFVVSDVRVPVVLWHGTDDAWAPMAMGRYLARTLPRCQAIWLPGEGHLLMFKPALWRSILDTLAAA